MTSRAKTDRANAREHVPTRMCKSAKTCIRGVCCAQYSVESPEVKRATETESIRRGVQCTDLIFYRNVTNSIISCPVTHSKPFEIENSSSRNLGLEALFPTWPCLPSGPAWLGRCSARARCPVRSGAGGSLHTGKRYTFTATTLY